MVSQLSQLQSALRSLGSPAKARILQRFFKTGPGEYGEGDVFWGITVPVSRELASKHKNLPFADIAKLISSKHHEARLVALLILCIISKRGMRLSRKKSSHSIWHIPVILITGILLTCRHMRLSADTY